MKLIKIAAKAAWVALSSKEARKLEIALARLVAVGIAAKTGVDLSHWIS